MQSKFTKTNAKQNSNGGGVVGFLGCWGVGRSWIRLCNFFISKYIYRIYKLHCRSLGGLWTNNKCLEWWKRELHEFICVFVCTVYSINCYNRGGTKGKSCHYKNTRHSFRMIYQSSSVHCSKVISKVKVLNRMTKWHTWQKQYAPDLRSLGLKR